MSFDTCVLLAVFGCGIVPEAEIKKGRHYLNLAIEYSA